MKKIRLLAIIPNRDDATSFYRAIGPLSALTREMESLEVMEPSKVTWSIMAGSCDVLFMQRPFSDDHLLIAQMAMNQRKKTWIDYDDDLFTVPRSNPASRYYGNDKIQRNIAMLCQMADVVTVSTETLKDALQKRGPEPLCKDCRVISNALPMHIIPPVSSLQEDRKKLVMWRGSHTHHEDLDLYLDPMVELMREFKDWTFHFQGDAYWRLVRVAGDNVMFAPPIDILEYFHLAASLQPRVLMVPLADHAFNRSKSNIAQLEGLWAGAIPVVPDMPEWTRLAQSGLYRDQQSFYSSMRAAMTLPVKELNREVSEGRDSVLRAYTLDSVNQRRINVLRDLFTR